MNFDAVVVGAGFAGIYMLHRLREAGLSAVLIEAGGDVGGVWYWNRYPGVRCDIESLDYQFQFSEEIEAGWHWPERYSEGAVIQRYLSYVTDRLGLRPAIRFDTWVDSARYDATGARWTIGTDRGDRIEARYLLLATGPLTVPNTPDFKDMEQFRGRMLHTAFWPREPVDFAGRRVAVVGTGSSAIQSIPLIARQASRLTVFQRTPTFSFPVHNNCFSEEEVATAHARFAEDRARRLATPGGMRRGIGARSALEVSAEEREAVFEENWSQNGFGFLLSFNDILTNIEANEAAATFVRRKIAEKVRDPRVARLLTPTGYPIGAKRPCLDLHYYETFNRPHVELVDARERAIERFSAEGIVAGGVTYGVDDIVLATGFDAVTGSVLKIDIRGRDGRAMRDAWAEGPTSYLGLCVAGFPNLFILDGANAPSIMVNAPAAIEHQVDWVMDCIGHMERHGLRAIEADPVAERDWVAHVREVANHTLYPRAESWAMGANIPGKPRGFMFYLAGLLAYRARCDEVVEKGYAGFHFAPA